MLHEMLWRRFFSPVDPENWQLALAVIIPTAAFALIAARVATGAAARTIQAILRDTLARSSPLVRGPLRLIGLAAFLLTFFVLLFPAFELAGLHPRAGLHLRTLSTWTFDSGLRTLLIIAVAFATVRTVAIAVKRFEHDVNFGTGLDALERAKRAHTLGTVLTNITTALVLVVATLMILNEFGVNTSAAVTGAGIVGVALGFGAQTLVRDVIAGLFILAENQFSVGDVIEFDGKPAAVEELSLRCTTLRNFNGYVHFVPNGELKTVTNRSRGWTRLAVDVPVATDQNLERALDVCRRVVDAMNLDPQWKPRLLDPVELWGVETLTGPEAQVRMVVRARPGGDAPDAARELRLRAQRALNEAGIRGALSREIAITPLAAGVAA
jgi:small conductance mechanosensitive channel